MASQEEHGDTREVHHHEGEWLLLKVIKPVKGDV